MYCYNADSHMDKAVLRQNISVVDPPTTARLNHEEAKNAELIKAQRQAGNGWRILAFIFVLGSSLLSIIAANHDWSNPFLYLFIGSIIGTVCLALGTKRVDNECEKIILKYAQKAYNSQSEEKTNGE